MKKLVIGCLLLIALLGANGGNAQVYAYEEAPGPHYAPLNVAYDVIEYNG